MLLTSWVRSFRQSLNSGRRSGLRRRSEKRAAWLASNTPAKIAEQLERRELLTSLVIDQQYVDARNGVVNITNVNLDIDGDGLIEAQSGEFDSIIVSLDPTDPITGANTGINITLSGLQLDRIAFKEATLRDPASNGIGLTLNNVTLNALTFESVEVQSGIGGGINVNLTDVHAAKVTVFDSKVVYDTVTNSRIPNRLNIAVASQTRNSTLGELDISNSTLDGLSISATGRQLPVVGALNSAPIELITADHSLQNNTLVDVTGINGLTSSNTRTPISPVIVPNAITQGLEFEENSFSLDTSSTHATLTQAIDNDDITLAVTSNTLFYTNQVIEVGDELMQVSAVGTATITVTRGILNSTPTSHAAGETIRPLTASVTLSGIIAATPGSITFPVSDGRVFQSGQLIQIDAEQFLISMVTENSLTVSRAQNGTTVAQHLTGARIRILTTVSTLAAAITDQDSTFTVGDGTQFAVNQVIQIDNEAMLITGIGGNQLTVQRSALGTGASAHSAGSALRTIRTSGTYAGGGSVIVPSIIDNIRLTGSRILGQSGDDGVSVTFNTARVGAFDISNNISVSSIDLNLTDSPTDGLTISNNTTITATRPQINGIQVDLVRSTLTNVSIASNTITGGNGTGGGGVAFDAVDSNVYGEFRNNVVQQTVGNGLSFTGSATASFLTTNRGPQVFDFDSLNSETTLSADISGQDTEIPVIDGRSFQAQQLIRIGDETAYIVSVRENVLDVVRGQRGSIALPRNSGTRIRAVSSSASGDRRLITGNIFRNNQGAGLFTDLPQGVSLKARVESNQFLQNQQRGIDIEVQSTVGATSTLGRSGLDRVVPQSEVATDIDATSTTLSLVDAREYYKFQLIQIGDEQLRITEVDGNILTVQRGVNHTVAAAHVAGDDITAITVPLRLTDASPFIGLDVPFNINLETEQLTVEAADYSNDVLLVSRGANGTAPAFHPINSTVVATRGDAVNLTIGGTTRATGNLIQGNSVDGIHLLLQDGAAGSLQVSNNTVIGTAAGSGAGNGVSIELLGTNVNSQADNVLRRSLISNNLIGVAGVGQLVSQITVGTTVFAVTDASAITAGTRLRIDGELMDVTNVSGNTLTVTRAVAFTSATAHTAGTFAVPNSNGNSERGLNLYLDELSALEDFRVEGNVIANNSDDGIRIRREGDAETRVVNPANGQTRALAIINNTIVGNALEPTPEQLQVNGAPQRYGAGLEIYVVNGSTDVIDAEIRNNRIISNVRSGFNFTSNNTSTESSNGINLRAEADAQIIADMSNNTVTYNQGDAIELTTRENGNLVGNGHGVVATDLRDIGGSWTSNLFANNFRNGIELAGRFGSRNILEIGREGSNSNGSLGNTIMSNGLNGIDIRAGGSAAINNNNISSNGPQAGNALFTPIGIATPTAGQVGMGGGILGSGIFVANANFDTVTPTGQDANRTIQLSIRGNVLNANSGIGVSLNGYLRDSILATIRNNQITFNQNDGIEFRGRIESTVLGNFISQNSGRGIDILNHATFGSAPPTGPTRSGFHSELVQSNYRIGDGTEDGRNRIVNNFHEGINYVSSSDMQDINLRSTDPNARNSNGAVQSWPAAIMQINGNTVSSNGVNSGLAGTGIVFWIGSAGGASDTAFLPYINSEGLSTGPGTVGGLIDGTPFNRNLTGARTSVTSTTTEINSRTNAQVINNTFEGNFGDDFRVASFVSTVDPTTTQLRWNAPSIPVPPYTLTTYQSDPLSRLNLEFIGNRGNGLNVRNYSSGYTNSEPIFKSKPGSSGRVRDVTRAPSRSNNNGRPLFDDAANGPFDAHYLISNITEVDIGNGISELRVAVGVNLGGVYGAGLPPGARAGSTVEIYDALGVGGLPHSANGIYQIVDVDRLTNQFTLAKSGGQGGPSYLSGGIVVFNLRTIAGDTDAPPFQFPGLGPSVFRVSQGYDSSGAGSTNAFRSGDNFFGDTLLGNDNVANLFSGSQFSDPQDWGIWTPLRSRNGVVTDVSSIQPAPNRLTVTSPNHGLTNMRLIEMSGISGFPSANGIFQVDVVSSDTFIVNLIPNVGAGTVVLPSLSVDGSYLGGGEWRTIDDSFPNPSEPTFPIADVVNVTPDPRSGTPGVVTLNFTEPVKNLDVDDLFVTRDGIPLDVSGATITEVSPKQYIVDLSAITQQDGAYHLIVDTAFPTAEFVAVTPDPTTGPTGNVTLNFSENVTGVDINDFVLQLDRGDGRGYVPINLSETGSNTVLGTTTTSTLQGANLSVRQITPSQYSIDLTTVSDAVGNYRLTLAAPRTVTLSGLQDQNGTALGLNEQVRVFAQDHGLTTGQYVTIASVRGQLTGANTAINGRYRIEVLDTHHFRLATDAEVTTFLVADDFNYSDGTFTYTPEIVDRVGRPFSIDAFNVTSDATTTWTRINTAPTANIIDVDPDPRPGSIDRIRVIFSEKVNFGPAGSRQITSSDFRLTRDVGQGAIPVNISQVTIFPIDLDANNYVTQIEVRNLASLTSLAGRYRFTIINNDATRINDIQGTTLASSVIDDFQVITNGPHPTLVPVTPARTDSPIPEVTLQFSQPVDGPIVGITTLDATRHLRLTRDVGDGRGKVDVPLVDAAGLPLLLVPTSATSPTDFVLDVSAVTSRTINSSILSVDGSYELTLLPGLGIKSRVGPNFFPLAVGSKISWIQDSIRPTADIVDIDPDPRATGAGSVTVQFSEPVSGVSRTDASVDFTLTYDAQDNQGPQPVSLAGVRVRPIRPTDEFGNAISDPFFNGTVFASEYVIDFGLTQLTTAAGFYSLSLTDAGQIEDLTHNPYRVTADAQDSWQKVVKLDNNRITDLTYSTSPIYLRQDIVIPSLKFLATSQADNPVAADATEDWFQDSVAPEIVPGSVAISPDPRSTSVGIVTLQFSEDVVGVSISDFVLTRDGKNVSLTSTPLVQVSPSIYTVDLNLVTGAAGKYEFSVQGTGSLIFDTAGNPIAEGLTLLDTWDVQSDGPTGNLTISSPRTTAANNVQLAFSKPVLVSSITLNDFVLERDSGSGFVSVGTAAGRLASSQGSLTAQSPSAGFASNFVLDLSTVTSSAGTFRLTLVAADSGIVDVADVELAADTVVEWVLDNVAPTGDVVDVAPDPLPPGTSAGIVNIVFSEPVDMASVDLADFQLLRNGTPIPLTGINFQRESNRRFTLDLTTVTTIDAEYQLRLMTNDTVTPIRDLAGNKLQAVPALGTNIAARDVWFQGVDTVRPTATFSTVTTPRNTAVSNVTVTFSEDVVASTVNPSDFRLTRDSVPVDLSKATITPAPGSESQYILNLENFTNPVGTYTLSLVSPDTVSRVVDKAGNELASGVAATATWVNQQIDPFPTLSPVSPAIRYRDAGIVTLNFTSDVEGVDINDFVLTRRNGTEETKVSLTGLTVAPSANGPDEYFIDLSAVTGTAGEYRFQLIAAGSGIQEPGGNPLLSNAVITWTTLNQIDVNVLTDRIDPAPGDGVVGETISNQPVRSLRAAVMEAGALAGDDTIVLGVGTYSLSQSGTGEDFAVRGDLDIYDTTGFTRIVGAGSGQTIIDGGDLDRIFHVTKGATLILEGVTLQNGNVSVSGTGTSSEDGGALRNDSGTVIIRDSVLISNESADDGGAINNDGSLTIINTTITGNKARNNGGAIRNVGNLRIENSLIGGTLDTTVTPNVDTRNEAGLAGGAIANLGSGAVSIWNSTISGNRTTGATSVGGAIANLAPVANSTTTVASALTAADTTLLVADASQFPDQLFYHIQIGTETLRVVAASGNRLTVERGIAGAPAAQAVGATVTLQSNFNILNTTISANQSASRGGGLFATTGRMLVQNTIIAGNTSISQGPDVFGTNVNIVAVSTNIIGNNANANLAFPAGPLVGTPIAPLNPQIGALADNGGPTKTHSLLRGSPAVNAGTSTNRPVLTDADATDQRGITRILATVDIGAFESGGFFVIDALNDTPDATPGDGIVADNYGRATLRAAIMEANALPGPNAIKLSDSTYVLGLTELDRVAPTVSFSTVSNPLGAQTTNLDPVDTISLTFSEPVRLAAATQLLQDIQIVYTNSSQVTTVTTLSATAATITPDPTDLTRFTLGNLRTLFAADGQYQIRFLTFDSAPAAPFVVADFEGNRLARDLGTGFGAYQQFVRGADVFAPTAVLETVAPIVRTISPTTVRIDFSEAIAGISTDNFTLSFNDGMNPIVTIPLNSASIQQITTTQYVLDLTSVAQLDGIGAYTLSFDTTPTAVVQDLSLQTFASGPLTTTWSIVADTFAPVAQWTPVTPTPRIGHVGVVTITFDEDVEGIDLNDADVHFDLTIDIDGSKATGVQPPSSIDVSNLTVTQVDPRTYTIDLTDVTIQDGLYSLTFDPVALGSPAVTDTATPVNPMTTAGRVTTQFIIGDDLAKFGGAGTFDVNPEDAASFGDLDVIDAGPGGSLTIIGAGASTSTQVARTSINAAGIDRVFDLYPGNTLTLRGLEVTGGNLLQARDGAAIRNDSGSVVLDSVDLVVNTADDGRGGAIFNNGTLELLNAKLESNSADFGGGVYNDQQGTVTVDQGEMTSNRAGTDGGAIYNDRSGNVTFSGASVRANLAGRHGGAVYNNDLGQLSIQDSTITSNTADEDGGAIFNELSQNVTIVNSTLALNLATRGGAIFDQDGVINISDAAFSGNSAREDGGAIYLTSSAAASFDNSTASGNLARDGGAIFNNGTLNVSESTLSDNQASGNGGAIRTARDLTLIDTVLESNDSKQHGGAVANAANGKLSVTRTTFSLNVSDSDGSKVGDGAAIANFDSGSVTIVESSLLRNRAGQTTVIGGGTSGGGIYHASTGTFSITNSTIAENSASLGGGISTTKAMSLSNSTVSSNFARNQGGGFYNNGGAITVVNGTIYDNLASNSGGGIHNQTVLGAFGLKNTIVAGNNATTGKDLSGSGYSSQGNNLIGTRGTVTTFQDGVGGNIVGTDASRKDPLLGPLQANGGPTATHALLFGSPARDKGSNVGVATRDQRGFARVFDGDGNGLATVDIGAFESGFVVNTFLDTRDVRPGDLSSADEDGNSSLRAAIMEANQLDGDDTILLIPGTFRLTIAGAGEDAAASGDLDIVNDSITIIGAGADQTFIDAAQLDRVFDIKPGATLDLKNLTILGGDAILGGGVLNQGTLTTENVVIRSNTADFGAGVHSSQVQTTLSAAITAAQTSLTVPSAAVLPAQVPFDIIVGTERMTVTNVATTGATKTLAVTRASVSAAHALGATLTIVGSATITDTEISGNRARLQGGGVFNTATMTIDQSRILGNETNAQGAGIFNQRTLTLTDTTIDSNQSRGTGGGLYNDGVSGSRTAVVTMDRVTISNNIAATRGGGIYNTDELQGTNLTVSTNRAGATGGGIYNRLHETSTANGVVTLTNATIVFNSTDGQGAGVANATGTTAPVRTPMTTIRNTIISNNTARRADADVSGVFVTNGNNFIGQIGSATGIQNLLNDDQVGTASSPFDAVLAPLADNGGFTQTHALLAGSPAIGKGNNSGGQPQDQRLGIRPVDTTSDIGSFEVQFNTLRIEGQSGILEGDSGQQLVSFVVLLSQPAAEEITVDYTTEQDSATDLSDFLPVSGRLTFAPGETTKSIVVEVNGDITAEDTEKFKVKLSNPVNASFELATDAIAEGVILNDDAYVSVTDVTIVEGDSGSQTAVFTVTLDKPVIDEVTVEYATTDVSALAGSDYVAASGKLNFAVGQVSQTVSVTINGDTTLEAPETFNLVLSNAIDDTGATLPFRKGTGVGTIANDEVSIALQDLASVLEGNAGANTPLNFTVTLAQPVGVPVSIRATAVNGTAIGGSDFTAISQVITFAAGETSKVFSVNVIGDNRYEDPNPATAGVGEDETLTVTLSSPTRNAVAFPSATVDSTPGNGAIQNDDPAPAQWVIRQDGAGAIEVLKDNVVQSTVNLTNPLTVTGTAQDDVFTVDYVNGNPIPTGGLSINGGLEDGGDVLIIQDGGSTVTANKIVYTATGGESGAIDIDGSIINYTELEPITDLLPAVDRTINLQDGVDHDAQLIDDTAITSNNVLFSQDAPATFESISFASPSGSLTINLGNGADKLAIGALDPALSVDPAINGGAGADQIDASTATTDLIINGGSGADELLGGDGDDTITGGEGVDVIDGGDGADVLRGHDAATADDNANDTLSGGAGNDTISGDGGVDSLSGDAGEDSLLGDADNDFLFGGDDNDVLDGGIGDDQLNGEAGDDNLLGDVGEDTLRGGDGVDVLDGGDSDDTLSGGLDNDILTGGAGNDVLNGDQDDDQLFGGDGNDTLQTSGGVDLLDGEGDTDRFDAIATADEEIVLRNTSVTVGMVVTTFTAIEEFQLTGSDDANRIDASEYSVGSVTIIGNGGRDTLIGGVANDVIEGGDGVDILYGQTGNDTIRGGNDRDSIYGEAGDDSILGEAGDDFIDGGNNSDYIDGGIGNDEIAGGSGNDLIYGGSGNDSLLGETGNDHLVGNDGEDVQDGGIGDDILYGGSGGDTLRSGVGNDIVDGQGSQSIGDLLEIADGTAGADVYTIAFSAPHFIISSTSATPFTIRMRRTETVRLNMGDGNDRLATSDLSGASATGELVRFELNGNGGNDTVEGGASNLLEFTFVVDGGAGQDSIIGGRGFDSLRGGDDGDYILGAIGKDKIYGDAGDDTLSGGGGNDSIQGGTGNDNIRGGSGADTLEGEIGNDTLFGDTENDYILGGDGDDKASGGAGNDIVDGGNGVDVLRGDDGNDYVQGGNGNDILSGGVGNDIVAGGFGRDYLFGNSGADTLRGSNDPDVVIGGDGNDSIEGNGGFDTLTGGNGGGDAPDADNIAETTEIDNAFAVPTSILSLLNF